MSDHEYFNNLGKDHFPGFIGLKFTEVIKGRTKAELEIKKCHLAPNGYLHAGTVVSMADTCAGYGCVASFPARANGFTTIELKSNHLGTALEGIIECEATASHLGKTTQVWDAVVTHKDTGKTLALFRCTQMLLYPKGTA